MLLMWCCLVVVWWGGSYWPETRQASATYWVQQVGGAAAQQECNPNWPDAVPTDGLTAWFDPLDANADSQVITSLANPTTNHGRPAQF